MFELLPATAVTSEEIPATVVTFAYSSNSIYIAMFVPTVSTSVIFVATVLSLKLPH